MKLKVGMLMLSVMAVCQVSQNAFAGRIVLSDKYSGPEVSAYRELMNRLEHGKGGGERDLVIGRVKSAEGKLDEVMAFSCPSVAVCSDKSVSKDKLPLQCSSEQEANKCDMIFHRDEAAVLSEYKRMKVAGIVGRGIMLNIAGTPPTNAIRILSSGITGTLWAINGIRENINDIVEAVEVDNSSDGIDSMVKFGLNSSLNQTVTEAELGNVPNAIQIFKNIEGQVRAVQLLSQDASTGEIQLKFTGDYRLLRYLVPEKREGGGGGGN